MQARIAGRAGGPNRGIRPPTSGLDQAVAGLRTPQCNIPHPCTAEAVPQSKPRSATPDAPPSFASNLQSRLASFLQSKNGQETSIVLAGLPWLGVPVLVSAVLAHLGRPLPGEILPVIAFLPIPIIAYAAAFHAPRDTRTYAIGLPGWIVVAALVMFLWNDPAPEIAATWWTALACAFASTLIAAGVGRLERRAAPLATGLAMAMVFSQSLDGWLTYFAVGNPIGWLPTPVTERVLVSRAILEAVPELFPLIKVALGVIVSLALARPGLRNSVSIPISIMVCYVGFSPAMFSLANLLAR
jgi:uncharacterized membrane protein